MFEFLFKYAPELYQRGTVQLSLAPASFALAAAVAAAVGVWLGGYLRRRAAPALRPRLALGALRGALCALLVFALCQPVLVVSLPETLRGNIAVLLDDSQSMRIADAGGGDSRAAVQQRLFAPGTGEIAAQLEQRFDTRYYRFGRDGEPLDPTRAQPMRHAEARSDLAAAIRRLRQDFHEHRPTAVVLVSDGALDRAAGALDEALLDLRVDGIAVHTIGVGAPEHGSDVELVSVQAPRRLLYGDAVEADVLVRQRGFDGRPLRLSVTEDGLLRHEQVLTPPPGQRLLSARVPLRLAEPGPHRLTFALDTQPGEAVRENNARRLVLDVQSAPARVLHFEGEPRFEVKFLRRALTGDAGLHLVSLVRTAENKFYRMGVEHAGELRGGFPAQAGELFDYRVLVLGSVELTHLSDAQQALLVDFVARRGGSLLLLGGRRSLAEGGHGQGPLVPLLPVELEPRQSGFQAMVSVAPTSAGAAHPVIRAALQASGAQAFTGMPALTVLNPITRVKPGATLLLHGERADAPPLVVLAQHRYGRGTVAVLAAADTWRWQLHHQVAVEDQLHETFWRQLLRWLGRPVRGRIELQATPEHPVPGERVSVTAEVADEDFQPLAGAGVRLTVTTATGDQLELPMTWAAEGEGLYRASFTARESGLYELRAHLRAGGNEPLTSNAVSLDATAAGEEYHAAALDRALLQRVARQTGGRYLDAAAAAELPGALEEPTTSRSRRERLPLWDAPALFLALVLLAGAEWAGRRRGGLA